MQGAGDDTGSTFVRLRSPRLLFEGTFERWPSSVKTIRMVSLAIVSTECLPSSHLCAAGGQLHCHSLGVGASEANGDLSGAVGKRLGDWFDVGPPIRRRGGQERLAWMGPKVRAEAVRLRLCRHPGSRAMAGRLKAGFFWDGLFQRDIGLPLGRFSQNPIMQGRTWGTTTTVSTARSSP